MLFAQPARETGQSPTIRPLAMVVGPTRPAPSVLARLAQPAPPINDPTFIVEIGTCIRQFRALVGSTDSSVTVVPGTGTAGLESVAVSLLRPGSSADRVLVLSTGMWGDRWADICGRNGIRTKTWRAAPGAGLDLDAVVTLLAAEHFQAVLVTHVDSSSGVAVDLPALAGVMAGRDTLLLIDGIAALGAEAVYQDCWAADAYLSAPPKAIAGPAGLSMTSLSRRAVALLRDRPWSIGCYSLDLEPWIEVMHAAERGEFGFFQSPAGCLIAALAEAQRLVIEEGLTARIARHRTLRDELHEGLAVLGLGVLANRPSARANGVTVCMPPPGIDPVRLVEVMAREGVIIQSGTHPIAGGSTFRIGHMGNVRLDDIRCTIDVIGRTLRELAA